LRARQQKRKAGGARVRATTVPPENDNKRGHSSSAKWDGFPEEVGIERPIFIKLNPSTGVKDVYSRCSKCGLLGSCRIQEEQTIQVKGIPVRIGVAKCFWMDHTYRVLMSE